MSVSVQVIPEGRDPLPGEYEFPALPRVGDVINVGRAFSYRVTKVALWGIQAGDPDKREMGIKLTVAARKGDDD